MNEVTYSRPCPPGGNFLVVSNGRPLKVIPRLGLVRLVLDHSSWESPFKGRGLWCWIFLASPFGWSIQPSFVGTSSFSGRLGLWLRPNNLGLALIVYHCFARQKIPSWGWWVLLWLGWQLLCRKLGWKASLLSGFMSLSYKPIERLVTPWAMLPLPLLIGPWWSWARSSLLLLSVHWLEDILGMSIGS